MSAQEAQYLFINYFFKGAGHSEDGAVLLHLTVIIAAGPQQAKQPTSQAWEGEAIPSVCKVCFNCD